MALRMTLSNPTQKDMLELLQAAVMPAAPLKASDILKQLINRGYRDITVAEVRMLLLEMIHDGAVAMMVHGKSQDNMALRWRAQTGNIENPGTFFCLVDSADAYYNGGASFEDGRQLTMFEKCIATGDVDSLRHLLDVAAQLGAPVAVPKSSPAFTSAKDGGFLKKVNKLLEERGVVFT